MAIVSTRNLTLGWSGPPVLDDVSFQIDAGERVALVGRNGSGKTTLLRVIGGDLEADAGEVVQATSGRHGRVRIARLGQEVPRDLTGDVYDVVADGLPELGALVAEYHHLSHEVASAEASVAARSLGRLEEVQHRLEASGGWRIHTRIETVVSRLGLDADAVFETLSGGMKRRVLLGRALVSEPDLLLLDEPTNHLDIAAIEWLEEMVIQLSERERAAVLFVTHDRAFLRSVATRVLELDRGAVASFPGDYREYVERSAQRVEIEERHRRKQDQRLAEEEAWIRQGIKARRTRNEGRVRALERLRAEVRERRQRQGDARFQLEAGALSGKLVIEAEDVTFRYDGEAGATGGPIISDFSTVVIRGDKIGVLGPNGSGKSTLLKLLLGRLDPQSGTVRHGTKLEVAYYDQHREQLDPDRTVAESVAEGNDRISVAGRSLHVITYLQSFLFAPDQIRSPVSALSGGERNRLMLARLFTRPFNLLVMDEPTNDLDLETLELLESRLVEFSGTLLLVSHDRQFLDNVVTSTLVMEGDGRVGSYAGGYSDWLEQRVEAPPVEEKKAAAAPRPSRPSRPQSGRRKLSYNDQRDLEALPSRIESLEAELSDLHDRLNDPDLYKTAAGDDIARLGRRLTEVQQQVDAAYERWAELEG